MVRSWRGGPGTSIELTPSFATSFYEGKVFGQGKTVSFSTRSPRSCWGMADGAQLSVGAPSRVGRAAVKKYLEGSQATEVCPRRCEMGFRRRRVRHGVGVTPGLRTDCFLVVLGEKNKLKKKNRSLD